MEHIAAVLLIVGCSNSLQECRELPAPVPLYEAAEDCQRESGAMIRAYDGKFAKIFGTCVVVDPALEEEDAELVWDITPAGKLEASIEYSNALVASNVNAARKIVNQ